MIECHYWPTPNGHKVVIYLEEAGLPYEILPVNIMQGEQFTAHFLEISPNNRIPAIIDKAPAGAGPAVSVFESGAILLYLARKTGKFWPADPAEEAETLQWLMWQMSGLGPMAGQTHHFLHYAPENNEYAANRYLTEIKRLYGVLDRRLADRRFIAGETYGIADMAIHPWIRMHDMHGQALEDFPNIGRWFDAVAGRLAVARAYEIGEPYMQQSQMDESSRALLFGQTAESTRARE